ncbi:uncharacterized protein [Fopius arisanus]|uniref:Dbp10 protein n=1 Tax=Fopius arisanus TaxID=64838 RepID=A0A0C9RKF0_9HYME|nr:PREDICTED: uncharacterized protein LOC105264831 [Fopius arisanus]
MKSLTFSRRMNIQILFLFTVIVVLLELVQLPEARKYVRPWKFHSSKARWHPFSRLPWYRFKRPRKYRRSKCQYSSRYASHHVADEEPYTIEIELPKHRRGGKHQRYLKKWDKRHRDYEDSEEDYEDESDVIFKERGVMGQWINGVNPKLRIKISRDDNLALLPFIDMKNVTRVDGGLQNTYHQVTPLTHPKDNHREGISGAVNSPEFSRFKIHKSLIGNK